MPKTERKSAERTIGVKYPVELDQRIQRVTAQLAKNGGGLPVPISFVMIQIAMRGLDKYEAELGITSDHNVNPISAAIKSKPSRSTKSATG